MFVYLDLCYFLTDCGAPDTPGYTFGTPTPSTTYQDTVSITGCATGYDGSPTPSSLTCEASGNWTAHTGCTIKGTVICKTESRASRSM